MKLKEITERIGTLDYPQEPSDEICELAKSNDIVIIFGASDDLMEFRGATDDEVSCYEGVEVHINRHGLVKKPDCDCEWAENWFDEQTKESKVVNAFWCKKGTENGKGDVISWTYETEIPHETFDIMEDGGIYCTGIVFSLAHFPFIQE